MFICYTYVYNVPNVIIKNVKSIRNHHIVFNNFNELPIMVITAIAWINSIINNTNNCNCLMDHKNEFSTLVVNQNLFIHHLISHTLVVMKILNLHHTSDCFDQILVEDCVVDVDYHEWVDLFLNRFAILKWSCVQIIHVVVVRIRMT